ARESGGQGQDRTADLPLIRKSDSYGSAAAHGGAPAEPGGVKRSCCGLQCDLVAEGFELADMVACLAAVADAVVVEAGAEVGVSGGGLCEQVPDDDQDGAADRDDGLLGSAAPGNPPEALTEEGVG